MTREAISRQEAKQKIDTCEQGYLIILQAEPVPAIGHVEKHKVKLVTEAYEFE